MRTAGILALCFLALWACRREPDFDERYDAANAKIGDMAGEIDAQIAGTPSAEADEVPSHNPRIRFTR